MVSIPSQPATSGCGASPRELADDVADAMPLAGGQDVIDAGRDVVAVVAERRHAAGGDDDLIVAAPVEQLGDGRHRLIPRRAEEAAGVDDDDPRVVRPRDGGHAARAQEVIHAVGIDPVLRAAEGQNVEGAIGSCAGAQLTIELLASRATASQTAFD